jgi:hypothetical protein
MKKIIYIFLFLAITSSLNAQWVQVWNGMGQTRNVGSLFYNSSILLAGMINYDWGIYISTNEGLTWNVTSLTNKQVYGFTSIGSNLYACVENGIYISNNGTNWSNYAMSNNHWIYSFAINSNYMYTGTQSYGVYYSTDNGASWTQSFLNDKTIYSLAVNNNFVIAGSSGNGIYYSTDNGLIWSQSNINNLSVNCIKYDGTTVYAGTGNGLYKSINNGANWTQIGLSNKNIYDIQFNGFYIYLGTEYDGIYLSNKQSLIWIQINDGLPTGNIYGRSLAFTSTYFIAGILGRSAYRRPKSQVGIGIISNTVPTEFLLSQNYPNPFNPTTRIIYDLPNNSFVKLIVFDITGKEIETLVNEKQPAGTYEATFNASRYPSGAYFYKLTTDNFIETKIMLLLR